MKTTLIGLILFCIVQNAFTQTDQVTIEPDEVYMTTMRNGLMGREYSDPVVGYKGDRFYCNWTKGEIFLTNGERITGLSLRYEGYLDQLLWLREDFKTGVLFKPGIKGFNLFDQSNNIVASFAKIRIKLPFESDSADCLLQVLVNGDYGFYAFRKISKVPDALELENNTKFYVSHNDQYKMIKLRTRDLLKVPFIDKVKMELIIKSNKIRLKDNEQEFIRVITLYNK